MRATNLLSKKITIVGGGIIGLLTGWNLGQLNLDYEIQIIDPRINKTPNRLGKLNGTEASLGVLMGNLFSRSNGRGWKLRQSSMKIWPEWIKKLNTKENPLEIKTPLIQLTKSKDELLHLNKLTKLRKNLGVNLIPSYMLSNMRELFSYDFSGGVISENDGYLNPICLIRSLQNALNQNKANLTESSVVKIERNSSQDKRRWKLNLCNGEIHKADIIILCTSIDTQSLLKSLGHQLDIEGILGQAIIVKTNNFDYQSSKLPAVISLNGFNLISLNKDEFLIGATLEPGEYTDPRKIETMKRLNFNSPKWLRDAKIINSWIGVRARPINRAAPILDVLEPGLIIATGHYRNGVLLGPATAKWVEEQVKNDN